MATALRAGLGLRLVGDGVPVPCIDGVERPYLNLDSAASTNALPAVADAVTDFLPWYASVHRGAGHKSQVATLAYEEARETILSFAGRAGGDDVAIICRNTTEAINHLAYRLGLTRDDVVVTTVVEHHANLLPWRRVATCRYVECDAAGTFTAESVLDALDASQPATKLLAITGASNITGWTPPLDAIIAGAHARGIPVAVDAAQLAPHAPPPREADFVSFSGHKMYAPFGAGALIGPRDVFAHGDPFLAGGNAVELVELDDVVWRLPPDREEAGSPNVIGAVAFAAAITELGHIGWERIADHDREVAVALRRGIAAIPGARLLGPGLGTETHPIATFVVDGMPYSLVAARLSAEHAIGVRHGCFCAHPYLMRLLGVTPRQLAAYRSAARRHDRHSLPGAVRASAGIATTLDDVARLLSALELVVTTPPPVAYVRDPASGDYRADRHPGPYAHAGSASGCGHG